MYEAKNKPLQLYGISLNEDHFRYNVFKNSMIQDRLHCYNAVRLNIL